MFWGAADVTIIEIKYTTHVMCLNHPENIPPAPVHGKIVFHKLNPSAKKGWGPLSRYCRSLSFLFLSPPPPPLFNVTQRAHWVDLREYLLFSHAKLQSPSVDFPNSGFVSNWGLSREAPPEWMLVWAADWEMPPGWPGSGQNRSQDP